MTAHAETPTTDRAEADHSPTTSTVGSEAAQPSAAAETPTGVRTEDGHLRAASSTATAEAPATGVISRLLPTSLHRRIPAVLHRRDFRRFWLGHSVSLIGDEVHRIAMPLAAVLLFGAGATAMSWLTAAPMIPALLLSIPAGIWVDRVPAVAESCSPPTSGGSWPCSRCRSPTPSAC